MVAMAAGGWVEALVDSVAGLGVAAAMAAAAMAVAAGSAAAAVAGSPRR